MATASMGGVWLAGIIQAAVMMLAWWPWPPVTSTVGPWLMSRFARPGGSSIKDMFVPPDSWLGEVEFERVDYLKGRK
jgi:hypothetical protein